MELETIDLQWRYQQLIIAIKLHRTITATQVINLAGVSSSALVYATYSKSHNVEIYNRLAIAYNELNKESK